MRLYYGADFVDIMVDSTADVLDAAATLITTHTPHIKLDALPITCKVAARILHGGVSQVGMRLTIGPGITGGDTISPSSYSPSLVPQRNNHQSSSSALNEDHTTTCQLLLSKAYQKPSQLVTYRSVLEVILLNYDANKGFEMFLREDLEFIGSIDPSDSNTNDGTNNGTERTATAIRANAASTSLSSGNAEHYSKNSIFGNNGSNKVGNSNDGNEKRRQGNYNTSTGREPTASTVTNQNIRHTPTFTSDYIEDEGARKALINRNYELKRELDRSASGQNIRTLAMESTSFLRNKAVRPTSTSSSTNSHQISTTRREVKEMNVGSEQKYSQSFSNDIDTRGFVSLICEFNPPVITLVGSAESTITNLLEDQIFEKCVAPTAQAHYYEEQYGFGAPKGGRYEAYMRNIIANKTNETPRSNDVVGHSTSPTRQTYNRASSNRPRFVDIHQDRTVRIQRLSLPHHHFNEVQQAALYLVIMDTMEQCAKNGIGMGGNYSSEEEDNEEDFKTRNARSTTGNQLLRRAKANPKRQAFYYKLVPFDGETSVTHNIVKQAAINNLRAIRGPQGRFTDGDLLTLEPYKHSCELLFIPTPL